MYDMAPPRVLTREQIAEAALRLADQTGVERLTMRALADELGVGTMTLYSYVRSRDDLLDLMVDTATEPVAATPIEGHWTEQIVTLFSALHEVLTKHPGLVRARMTRPFNSPGVMRLAERALSVLQAAGMDRQEAARAYRTLYLFTLGCATYGGHSDTAQLRRDLEALPSTDFPHVAAHRDKLIYTVAEAAEFRYGLRLLVTAMSAYVPPPTNRNPQGGTHNPVG